MTTPNEFWLCLHQLAEAYEAEGLTTDERTDNILAGFRVMPHIARRQILDDFRLLAINFPDLFALSVAADRQANEQKAGPKHGAA